MSVDFEKPDPCSSIEDETIDWIRQVEAGDQVAAAKIWDAYAPRLQAYARRKLGGMPCRDSDEEDVVVSAMNSFFRAARDGRMRPQNGSELWKLLATFTVRKASTRLRQYYAKKRGGGLVRGESVFINPSETTNASPGLSQITADEEVPELIDELLALCETRLGELPDALVRQIASLRLQGYEINEIAEAVECSPATVKRKLAAIREQWTCS
ncbi:ECF-type sigma factor [Rhodopirellula sp. SWK7]|uniref:ECF-type sigma factor n=1 Tax=Rhodopirellula sp. SWK7 TaxID=595460 RepID=UPI0002BE7886|nr:ECF-type sigma factor [Rhodopirellula sp. SWK7]EMI43618.1 RNA polymerase sigma-70 ECF-like protein [Rhodopirellula sp. SWK7]